MKLKLKVLQGASANQEISVPLAKFLIGRGEDCHLRPKSPAISRHHCVILTTNGQASVKDLGSKNGTFVNNQQVDGLQKVESGDILAFGPLTFEVVIDHTLGGEKRPKVRDIADVAERTQKDPLQDNDVAAWLEEGDVTKKDNDLDETSTRQFQVKQDANKAVSDEEADDTTIMMAPEADETTSDSSKKKKKKKEFGKLPPRVATDANSSRDAADSAIKRYFNRS